MIEVERLAREAGFSAPLVSECLTDGKLQAFATMVLEEAAKLADTCAAEDSPMLHNLPSAIRTLNEKK